VVVATVGEQGGKGLKADLAEKAGASAATAMHFFDSGSLTNYFIALAGLALVTVSVSIWKRKRKRGVV
jgi:LPXTG-motif cell wall-anchored protein